MEVYSGHDTTIAPLLLTLGDDETAQGLEPINITWPPFSSTVRIETFRDDSVSGGGNSNDGGDGLKQISGIVGKVPAGLESMMSKYFVRVHYMDRLVQLPACQKPGNHHPKMGSQLCTLDAFLKQVASILPEKTVQQGSSSLVVTSGPKEDEVAESRGGNGSGNLSLV
ncbi:hypothetical protein EV182_008229 [Spiromyces aspiralis]|uniref:Uncharacterized protein n=1 Tax=Spiromyces aspiralis TaxID=68401 RepID=A0ACC1HA60_9FUNG|nr:hypothetical protein EV182_008229 [Spiromyces aspiralis]